MNHDLRVICPDKGCLLGWVRQRDEDATWEPRVGDPVALPWREMPPAEAAIDQLVDDPDKFDFAFPFTTVLQQRCACGNREVPVRVIAAAIRQRRSKLIASKSMHASAPRPR